MFWTDEEDEILKDFFPTEGTNVCLRLHGRSRSACANRAKRLNITSRRMWSSAEDDVLKEYYAEEGGRVYLRLPGRDKASCQKRALALGLHFKSRTVPWSKEEDAALADIYPKGGAAKAAKHLQGRSEEACRQRASALGLAYSQNSSKWTPEEDLLLMEYYPSEGSDVKRRLHGRSKTACVTRAKKLGIKYQGLSRQGFNPLQEYIRYINSLASQEQTGVNDFILTFPFHKGKDIVRVPITVTEGEVRGLLISDGGHVSRLEGIQDGRMKFSAEAYGISYKEGILSASCSLVDFAAKLNNVVSCILFILSGCRT